MTADCKFLVSRSPECRAKLVIALKNNGGNDLITHYESVAFAFPSQKPNPWSYDYPLIDEESFIQWAYSNGWEVLYAPENASKGNEHKPPVRFRKKAA